MNGKPDDNKLPLLADAPAGNKPPSVPRAVIKRLENIANNPAADPKDREAARLLLGDNTKFAVPINRTITRRQWLARALLGTAGAATAGVLSKVAITAAQEIANSNYIYMAGNLRIDMVWPVVVQYIHNNPPPGTFGFQVSQLCDAFLKLTDNQKWAIVNQLKSDPNKYMSTSVLLQEEILEKFIKQRYAEKDDSIQKFLDSFQPGLDKNHPLKFQKSPSKNDVKAEEAYYRKMDEKFMPMMMTVDKDRSSEFRRRMQWQAAVEYVRENPPPVGDDDPARKRYYEAMENELKPLMIPVSVLSSKALNLSLTYTSAGALILALVGAYFFARNAKKDTEIDTRRYVDYSIRAARKVIENIKEQERGSPSI